MNDIYEIVQQLQSTAKRTEKENILSEQKANDDFKQFLQYVFDPFRVYGIKDKKLNKFLKTVKPSESFQNLFEVFEYLSVNNTGNDETVRKVAKFIKSQPEGLQDFYTKSITKTLRTGCSASTYNKVMGKGFIPKFDCQLAKKYEDYEHKVQGEFVLTEKLDGCRILTIVEGNEVKFFTRQGQVVTGLVEIEKQAKYLPDNVYDGEILIHNADEYKDRDVLQETLKIVRKDGDKKGLVLHLFDMLTVYEFRGGRSKTKFIDRKNELMGIIDTLNEAINGGYIQYVPNLYVGKDKSTIPELLKEMEDEGKEGLMLNISEGNYICKRTDAILKVKSMSEFDEVIVDAIEGDGKYKGKLGAFVVKYKGKYTLKIGSGYSDQQREEYWQQREELKGRVITVQYFRESKSKNGNLSVSFPIFKQIREVGKEASYY